MRGRRRNKVLHDLAHYDGYVGQQRTDGGTEKDIKNLLYSRRLLTMMLLPDVGKSLTVLTAIFPGEPGSASFIEAKYDGSGGDNWSYKSCKAPLNRHHQQTNTQLLTGRMPFLSPNQKCQSTEGKCCEKHDYYVHSFRYTTMSYGNSKP